MSIIHIVLIICTIAMAAPAAAQIADTPWAMFHHDLNHTGLSPYYGPDTPAVKWNFSTEDRIYGSAVIAEDGTIYVGTRDHNSLTRSRLYAINPDGTKRWHWNPPLYSCRCMVDYTDSSPAVASDGTIYVGCWNHRLYALYPNGTERWVFHDTSHGKKCWGFVLTSPVIAPDGTIYIGNNNGRLYAINSDGSFKWSYQTGGAIQSSPAVGHDSTIYVGSHDKNLYAIKPDGTLKWNYDTGAIIRSSPAIGSDGTVYVGSWNKKLYAINPDGTFQLSYTTGGKVDSSPAIDADGIVYVGSQDGSVYAIYPDGTLKWSYTTGGKVKSSPAIDADGTVYVGSRDGYVYAINPDGSLLWKYNTENGIYYSSPAIASDGTVYIGNYRGGKLYAFGPGTIPNRPLVLDPIGPRTAYEAAELNITITASDPDGDPLAFSSNATYGTLAMINSTATYWNWTPDYDDAGFYYVDFGVSDGEFNNNETVTIIVEDVNRPPEIEEIGNRTVNETETLTIYLNATDPDDDTLIYSCNRTDLFIDFDPGTGVGSWTTGYTDANTYYVDFGVSDGNGGIANETVTITVEDVNRQPELEEIGNQTVNESETITIDVNATDPDCDTLIYSCNRTDLFTDFNALTGIGSWTPNHDNAGTYYVDFAVSDGKGGIENEIVSITVEYVNRPPELEKIGDRSVNESELLEFTVNATDPDGDTLTYSASNLPSGATFDDDTSTFLWIPSFEQEGIYHDVHFEVSDGKLTHGENITIAVNSTNMPPELEEIGNQWGNENETLTIVVNATDPDGDTLTYFASNLPDGAVFNNLTRTFSWLPTFEQAGTYPGVHFEVSDGELINWTSITITVNDTNRWPVLEEIVDQTVNETEILTVDVNATDPDGDMLTYSCSRTDLFTDFNLLTGIGSWTPGYEDAATHYIDFGVSDGKGGIDNRTVCLTVKDVNRPPELEEIGNQTVNENETLMLDVNATDPDYDVLIYSCNCTDIFSDFNTLTGTGSWTPGYEDAGTYYIDFDVSDGKGGIDNITVSITVEDVNRPPELEEIGNKSVNESGLLEFILNVTDPDGDELAYSASNLPFGAAFNSTTGEFSWTPAFGQAGVYHDIKFEVTDGGSIDFENITITVTGVTVEISVLPSDITVQPEEQFDVKIHIDPNGLPVYAVQYYLAYNTSVVRAETQVKGPFLGNIWQTIVVINNIDQPNGKISYAETRKVPDVVDVEENVTNIHFIAIGLRSATTSLRLYDIIISDEDGDKIPCTIKNGTIELIKNQPPFANGMSKHRINNVANKYQSTAVICSCSYDPDYPGKGGNITYIEWALGDGQYETSEGLPVDNCICKEHKYESWQWDPLGDSGGDYVPFDVRLDVMDDGCPELTNTTNFTVNVYIAGDANGDGEVNILDAVWVGKHWRTVCGTTSTCANCEGYLWDDEQKDGTDLNNDCGINILDAVIIGANWRQTAW